MTIYSALTPITNSLYTSFFAPADSYVGRWGPYRKQKTGRQLFFYKYIEENQVSFAEAGRRFDVNPQTVRNLYHAGKRIYNYRPTAPAQNDVYQDYLNEIVDL